MPSMRTLAKDDLREAQQEMMSQRKAKGLRYAEKWSRVAEIGKGLKNLSETAMINTAFALENQARHMKKLTETQLQTAFQTAPENMLRVVRLTFPNSIRGEIFTDYVMETAKDSIYYLNPVYTSEKRGITADFAYGANEREGESFYKNMQTSKNYRFSTELENIVATAGTATQRIVALPGAGSAFELGYVPGYATFFNAEGFPIAVEDSRTSGVVKFNNPGTTGPKITGAVFDSANGRFVFTYDADVTSATGADAQNIVASATARYNSEGDINGTHLGDIEVRMTDYKFAVRPLTLGVSWTKMTEIFLGTTVGVEIEEALLTSASQEIKKALDFHSVKYAYTQRVLNGYPVVNFNAQPTTGGTGPIDSYEGTAQTIQQAISRVGDQAFNDIQRGGVSRIVGGPAAVNYLTMNRQFKFDGAQPRIGGHRVGSLGDIPVYKVPSAIVPDNQLLTVWKNDADDADIAIAFGTLIPFFDTGSIQRKNFYKERGLAHFGDYKALQPKYLGLIQINNMRSLDESPVTSQPMAIL